MLRQEGGAKALVQSDVTRRERAAAEKQIKEHVCLERWQGNTGTWITEEKCGAAR